MSYLIMAMVYMYYLGPFAEKISQNHIRIEEMHVIHFY
jgi:hypothetical protein